MSALLQASPLKNMASVPPQRWFRCGRIPGLRPPCCSERQLPTPALARCLFCHRRQLDWGAAFCRPAMQVVSGSSCLEHSPLAGPSAHPISLLFATPCSLSLFDTALPRRWQSHASPPWDTSSSSFCTCTMQVIRHYQESCVSPRPSRAFASLLHEQLLPPHPPAEGLHGRQLSAV